MRLRVPEDGQRTDRHQLPVAQAQPWPGVDLIQDDWRCRVTNTTCAFVVQVHRDRTG